MLNLIMFLAFCGISAYWSNTIHSKQVFKSKVVNELSMVAITLVLIFVMASLWISFVEEVIQ